MFWCYERLYDECDILSRVKNVLCVQVRTVKLADSLHSTKRVHGTILDKPVELTLGFRHVEYERGNCGIFLYWHKRLIQVKFLSGTLHSCFSHGCEQLSIY